MVACLRLDIGAPSAARLADEQALKVKQPNVVRPSIAADPYRVLAPVAGTIHQETANA